ncbi:MAG: hypothetical protein KME25_26170 [Symplocastrum torsivum CPER-KK1]|uniref:Uncharacterized protein n=1 Tax=Symplocastrum torsivum CPER-KK1 TaxID=450513 RepID=A0A951PPL1_9CYAN|nr:hypothetical protein [Symplocastrum torsivum CPER-KK1]
MGQTRRDRDRFLLPHLKDFGLGRLGTFGRLLPAALIRRGPELEKTVRQLPVYRKVQQASEWSCAITPSEYQPKQRSL